MWHASNAYDGTMDFGPTVKRAREALGWDQGNLARQIGNVTQQTVSRWERGGSRPRRDVVVKIATLLQLDPLGLLASAGYGPLSDTQASVHPPVRPRATLLPVAELSPDRFEELVADLAHRLFPDGNIARFGGPGHTQYGFDVVVDAGGSFVAGFQCKRHRHFGPEKVRQAVSAATLDVGRRFIVLTRVASPDSRIEMAKHTGWTLWDVEDISREVRGLPLDQAVRLIDTYFPGWRSDFLGVAEPGPWLQPEDYFRPLGHGGIYSHGWTLVGRAGELAGVARFLTGTDRLGCVVGRGGIGKTRLLSEVAVQSEAQEFEVRFLTVGAEVRPEHFELLPRSGRLVVIVDDAHDRSDTGGLLRGIFLRNPDAHVLLALRPYGLGMLAGDLRQVGLHPAEVPRWELDDLGPDDADALARQALGPAAPEQLVRRLAHLTADCPLITVVAGVLIQRGQLDASCLDHEDSVREEVLRAFRDVLVADPVGADSAMRRAVLDAVSVLQPFRSDDPASQNALAALISAPYDRVISHLRGLEDAGVLLRRGNSLRVVPDLLGDVVLSEACFDERSGVSTGYIERAVEVADAGPRQNIFVNAARMDWKIRHDRPGAPSLTDTLWRAMSAEFDAAGILGRRRLVEFVRRIAHFAPRETLALVARAIEAPTDKVEEVSDLEAAFLRLHPPSYRDVLRELPPLLRGVGYHLEYLPEALALLWELTAQDDRPTNQYPNHPLRVLRELAELELGKPLAFNDAVIDAASSWLAGDRKPGFPSPFEVVEPMLATEGSEDIARGYTLTFRPFVLTPSSVSPLRERILDLAFRELASSDIATAVRAVETIEHALRYPHGLFGREVDQNERDAWTPEFVRTLGRLADAVADPSIDPVVAIAIRRAVRWHSQYSPTETRAAATRVDQALPERPADQLAVVLFDGWGQLTDDDPRDYEKARLEREARTRDLATQLALGSTDSEIVRALRERLLAQRGLGQSSGNAGPFVWALVTERASIGVAIAEDVLADPSSPLSDVLAVSLAALADAQPLSAGDVLEQLTRSSHVEHRRHVAQALGWNRGFRSTLLRGEIEILEGLVADSDEYTRTNAVRAAQRLAQNHPDASIRLLNRVSFADSAHVADEVFQILGPHGDLRVDQLPAGVIDRLLDELEECPSIEGYWVEAFLADISVNRPTDLVDFLQRRVMRWESTDETTDYRPLPFAWNHELRVRETADLLWTLRRIRDWIAEGAESWKRQHAGPDLFAAVAGRFDADALRVIEEAVASGDSAQLTAAASILREVPRLLVFENVGYVQRLLALADQAGDDHVQRIGGALSAAMSSGARTGIPGQPFAEDVEQRDRAREIAESLPIGSVAQRLYLSLQASAEHSIKWHADRDELMDGRDW